MKILTGKETEYDKYKKVNFDDPYGRCIVQYGEEWAEEMEKEILAGKELEDIADETSHLVDRRPGYGITGFMYGAALQGLSEFWEYGQRLKTWHNNRYNRSGADKGVVNPAIISIG